MAKRDTVSHEIMTLRARVGALEAVLLVMFEASAMERRVEVTEAAVELLGTLGQPCLVPSEEAVARHERDYLRFLTSVPNTATA